MEVDGDQQEGVGGQVAGLLGGWLPWQAQLGHRLSQGCQPAPRAAAPPAQLAGWTRVDRIDSCIFQQPPK